MRGLVDPLDRLGGLRDRVDEILALRRQEGVARLELVELLDGHHVHRTETIDLCLELRRWRPSAVRLAGGTDSHGLRTRGRDGVG